MRYSVNLSKQESISGERLVLRAQLAIGGEPVVAHTTVVGRDGVIVRTDAPIEVGAPLDLELSLRGLLAPIQLGARVAMKEAGDGHGYFPGVTLAIESGAAQLAPLLGTTPPCTRPSSIMVVEDSAILRDVVRVGANRFAAEAGYPIALETLESAEAAIARFGERTFDVALVDLYLNGAQTGADVVREARARGSEAVMIGFSIGGAAARDAFLEAGADFFMDKPVMIKDLFATVGRLASLQARAEGS